MVNELHPLSQACSRGRMYKTNTKQYTYPPKLLCRFIVYTGFTDVTFCWPCKSKQGEYTFTNVVAVRRLQTQALGVRCAIRKIYDARCEGMAPQYYTFHRTGLNLDMARGYTEEYEDNHIIMVVTGF